MKTKKTKSDHNLKELFYAIENERCPKCTEPLRVVASEYNGIVEGGSYTCLSCGWESGFCTPSPTRPDTDK